MVQDSICHLDVYFIFKILFFQNLLLHVYIENLVENLPWRFFAKKVYGLNPLLLQKSFIIDMWQDPKCALYCYIKRILRDLWIKVRNRTEVGGKTPAFRELVGKFHLGLAYFKLVSATVIPSEWCISFEYNLYVYVFFWWGRMRGG